MSAHKNAAWIAASVLIAGCAGTAGPQRFDLVDEQSKVWSGSYDASSQGMSVTLADGTYSGFYVVATDTITTTVFPMSFYRRAWPIESRGTVVSNLARAHLRNEREGHLSCEFMFEGSRAVGACKSPAGKVYQFVAGQ